MTDLDRQIAEIKGWEYSPAGTTARIRIHRQGGQEVALPEGFWQGSTFHSAMNCDWSGSDSKALELVDELTHDTPNRLHNFSFHFEVMRDGRLSACFAYPGQRARIPTDELGKVGEVSRAFGASDENTPDGRRRAICRAYIAAVTWMRGRG